MNTNEPEKVLVKAVVVFLVTTDSVLLAKKTQKIGAGCWNGYGGGPEHGETIEQAGARELAEETAMDGKGVIVKEDDLRKGGIIYCHNQKASGERFTCELHVLLADKWEGVPGESLEMVTPTWFPKNNLPPEMMPADMDWLPQVLAGKKIIGHVFLGPRQGVKLEESWVREIESFENYEKSPERAPVAALHIP